MGSVFQTGIPVMFALPPCQTSLCCGCASARMVAEVVNKRGRWNNWGARGGEGKGQHVALANTHRCSNNNHTRNARTASQPSRPLTFATVHVACI